MKTKKTKPATAGEKIAKNAYEQAAIHDPRLQTVAHAESYIARRIDAAIRRAVRDDRKRITTIIEEVKNNPNTSWASCACLGEILRRINP